MPIMVLKGLAEGSRPVQTGWSSLPRSFRAWTPVMPEDCRHSGLSITRRGVDRFQGSLQGKMIMTTSDSPIAKTINLAGAFTQRDGRKLDASLSAGLKGMPPPSPPPSLILPSPARKVLQIQER